MTSARTYLAVYRVHFPARNETPDWLTADVFAKALADMLSDAEPGMMRDELCNFGVRPDCGTGRLVCLSRNSVDERQVRYLVRHHVGERLDGLAPDDGAKSEQYRVRAYLAEALGITPRQSEGVFDIHGVRVYRDSRSGMRAAEANLRAENEDASSGDLPDDGGDE